MSSDAFRASMRGKAQTVLGPIEPERLGVTMMHEHVLNVMPHLDKPPAEAWRLSEFLAPLTLETIGRIRFGGIANRENCGLGDAAVAIDELGRYRNAGGSTLVDVTSLGIGRDPIALAQIARATGLQIIMGCSYYVAETHPPHHSVAEASEDDLAARIIAELREGVSFTGIRPGIIGEVGCSWPLVTSEIKVLRASARAQRATGAPLTIHPGRDSRAPFEIVAILRDAGADLSRTVMGHVDRTIASPSEIERLAAAGCVIEFDLFGMEGSYYPWELPIDMPNDSARINLLNELIAAGFGAQIVISHDICLKDHLAKYGGRGYAHILDSVVPLMRRKGMREDDIMAILVDTPRRLLAFA
jgi:phosphotriesterase-related protein